MSLDRALGLLLFLPVPVVLVLFTQAPLGVIASLVLGVALMVTHRFYARPFALRRAARRCLWCGATLSDQERALDIVEPMGVTAWRACGDRHLERLMTTLSWAERRSAFLKAGIVGSLAAFLLLASFAHADATAVFRFGVAATVLPFGVLAPRGAATASSPRVPFPVHVQALIGTSAVLWLFRIVGVLWLALAVLHLARRLGAAAL